MRSENAREGQSGESNYSITLSDRRRGSAATSTREFTARR